VMGHILGGWALAGSYVFGSGQPYTPRQGGVFGGVNSRLSANGNYFDTNYVNAFVGDAARPFYGSLTAPANTVAIACGDLVSLLGAASVPCATIGGNTQLLSFNALNAPQACDPRGFLRGSACTVLNLVPVSKNDVRFIINMHTAQTIFGTPFGNVPRNPLVDATSNRLDASIFKNIKWGERSNFELRMSAVNALNHFNYGSIDPNMEDAGLGTAPSLFGVGFGNPAQTAANGRVVSLSGRFTF
jgi:hypothetical protein